MVSKIGENEGSSGAFICDFLVKDLRAAMQALNNFRGMVLDNDNNGNKDNNDTVEDNNTNDNDACVSDYKL